MASQQLQSPLWVAVWWYLKAISTMKYSLHTGAGVLLFVCPAQDENACTLCSPWWHEP